jgi:hypothetical protein
MELWKSKLCSQVSLSSLYSQLDAADTAKREGNKKEGGQSEYLIYCLEQFDRENSAEYQSILHVAKAKKNTAAVAPSSRADSLLNPGT